MRDFAPGDWETWVLSASISGTALGVSALLGPALVLGGQTVLEPRSWPLLALMAMSTGTIGSFCGLVVGLALAIADRKPPLRASRRILASALACVLLGALFGLFHQPQMGIVVGLVTALCAGVSATGSRALPGERAMPLRAGWLRAGISGLLILLTPLVYLACYWRPGTRWLW